MIIYLYLSENFLSTTKFERALPQNALMAAGVCLQFPVERHWGCLPWFQSCRHSRVKRDKQEMKKMM